MGVIGYVLSGIGLAIIVLSNQIFNVLLKMIPSLKLPIVIVLGVAFVLVGVILLMDKGSSSSSVQHAAEEVPIYEGEGKHKRIIGYKKAPKK